MSSADGSIIISTALDNKELEKELMALKKKIADLDGKVTAKNSTLESLTKEANELSVRLDKAKAKLREMQTAPKGTHTREAIADQRQEVALLQADYNSTAKSAERISGEIQKATAEGELLREQAGAVEVELVRASKGASRLGPALEQADKKMDSITNKLKTMASRALVFSAILTALRSLRDWMGKVIKTNDEATKAMAKLKGAALTMIQPFVNVVIPVFTALVNILTRVMTVLAQFTSFLGGTTVKESAKAAEALNEQVEALDGVGGAAKKAGSQLADFDDVNKQSDNDSSVGGGAGVDLSAFDPDEYKNKVADLEKYISGALLALGAILTFSGANIPLGLGLMAVGAIGLVTALKEDWAKLPKKVQDTILAVLLIVGVAAIVFGVIFLLTGHIGIGLGLIMVGALALWSASELGFDWDSVPPKIQTIVTAIMIFLGGVAIAFGVVLLFTGHIGLGLGLIAVGALAFWGASALGFDWDSVPPEIQAVVTGVLAIVSIVAIAFGVVFLFTGHIGLGLGLIAVGALAYWGASELGFNWDSLPPEVQNIVTAVLKIISIVALAFGVVFLFTGHIGLGLGLIAIGALAYWGASALGFNWDSLPPEIKGVIALVLKAIGTMAVVFGVAFLFTGNIGLGLGLIAVGAAALWGANKIGFNWDAVPPKVKSAVKSILEILTPAAMVFGAILLLTGNIPLGLALIGISAAAFFGLSKINEQETWDGVTDKVSSGLNDIEQEVKDHQGAMEKASEGLGQGLTDGTAQAIHDGKADVEDAITDTLLAGVAAGNQAMGIHSPSEVTGGQADEMVAGWENRLAEGAIIIGERTTDVMTAAIDAVNAAKPGIVDSFKFTFNAVLDQTQLFINRYLSALRDMLQQSADMMMALPDAPQIIVPPISRISIPALAAGAVIPPNREFLAVLGDQTRGTNIEAPESLLRKIAREESNGMATSILRDILEAIQAGHVIEMDGQTLGQAQRPYSQRADKMVGTQFSNRRAPTRG